jgi:6-phosphogluconolactonase
LRRRQSHHLFNYRKRQRPDERDGLGTSRQRGRRPDGQQRLAFYIDETTGSLVPVTGSPFAGSGVSIALTPNGRFAYVIGGSTISAYSIDPITGALSGIPGSPFAAGAALLSVAITPNGKLVYVVTASTNKVASFNINPATGALTPTSSGPFAASAGATVMAIDATGDFAYIAAPDSITAYTVDYTTGALVPIANGAIANAGGVALAIDPMGGFVYVSGNIASIYAFTMDGTTGLLSAVPGSPFTTGQFPQGLAVSPNGQFLYVPAQAANAVWGYSIDASTGALAQSTGSPFETGVGGAMPEALIVDASGKFAYGDTGAISIHTVDVATGGLSFVKAQGNAVSDEPISPFAIGSIH